MQLARITFRGVKPLLQAFFQLVGRRRRQRGHVRVNRQVVAHGVALHRTAHAVHIGFFATGRVVHQGEPGFAAADRGQIALHGHASGHAVTIGILQVHEGLAGGKRHHPQVDAVIVGPQRPFVCIELRRHVVRRGAVQLEVKGQGVGVLDFLRPLFADADFQSRGAAVAAGGAAELGVEVQHQHIAPVVGAFESRGDR